MDTLGTVAQMAATLLAASGASAGNSQATLDKVAEEAWRLYHAVSRAAARVPVT